MFVFVCNLNEFKIYVLISLGYEEKNIINLFKVLEMIFKENIFNCFIG